ncbi:nucleotidyltransferase [Alkalicella caledoniensis]|uniref:tRNA(Met) cytidine acetate ligase n=1 Tax=Alkalicella caledoniensis TaxID=2731377 RepID=A0A7G9WCF8_ALKCA|nr:nucleotidyltransferase [Alkalicella caledoniensis]QNO16370.1 nucleotidyltransferase [Alkalicella caledoniensis]
MKKVLGIIIEYNPFHNGHFYHIQKAKEITGCEFVVGVMSGNFVQRGEPSVVNKWTRSVIALNCGVDVVIELPTCFAIQSAEGFALGAVHLLANSGIVTDIVFGSEVGDASSLIDTARDLLALEKDPQKIREHLKTGVSYNEALSNLVNNPDILNGSNNILGLEYIKNLIKHDLNLKVSTIKRIKNDYNNTQLPNHNIASATALRPYIKANEQNLVKISKYMPKISMDILSRSLRSVQKPGNISDMSNFFFNLIYRQGISELKKLHRMEVGLENRFFSACKHNEDIDSFLLSVSSKRYSKSRVSRLAMQFILGLNSELIEKSNQHPGSYLRILGCSARGIDLLKDIKKHSSVPYSLNFNKLIQGFSYGSLEKELLEFEVRATNIYSSFFYKKHVQQLEYLQEAILLKN